MAGVKRKRESGSAKQIALDETDLEISLKERVAETVQSRITWARLLQHSLEQGSNHTTLSDNDFREAAIDALDTTDQPCDIIREPIDLGLAATKPPEAPVRTYIARNRPPKPTPPAHKVLFVRNSATPPLVARLQCPDCSRWDFTTTQGFLNHCRIRHQREYGNHDECIQQCSVLVPDDEREWVLQHGTEISIGIPSLRRLFEIAVSGDASSVFPVQAPSAAPAEVLSIGSATHLSRTLGLHLETPALAPFLGKTAHRRCINVVEQGPVDVDSEETVTAATWRMPFSHRNRARAELEPDVEVSDIEDDLVTKEKTEITKDLSELSSTRFHIVARVLVADRSRWLAAVKRPSAYPEHTHQWMISITSPSYGLHVTSVLASVTVSCLTDPPPSTLLHPIVVTQPPFNIQSTTDKPFLAQVSLRWNGGHNSCIDIEHWVEIDLMKTGHATLGDQQVLDIELDRKTDMLPSRPNPIQWKTYGQAPSSPEAKIDTQPAYVSLLWSLLRSVPMTQRETKMRSGAHAPVPYMLASTPAQFRKFVFGRQKAIEWGRARTLHRAYSNHLGSSGEIFPVLSVYDVYSWLEDEELFPRPKRTERRSIRETDLMAPISDSYCPSCGVALQAHVAAFKSSDRPPCDVTYHVRPPAVDIARLFRHSDHIIRLASPRVPSLAAGADRDLVHLADPLFTIAVRTLVTVLKLPHFDKVNVKEIGFGAPARSRVSKEEVERNWAPYALLSLATGSFLRHLVQTALTASETASRHLNGGPLMRRRVVTPAHLFEGLHRDLAHGNVLTDFAVGCALARLGAGVHIKPEAVDVKVEDR